jgi:NIMA (never in mitosis gene a)-related kinase
MEYADNGDLYQKICEAKKAKILFDESEVWKMFIQMVKGLKSLHDLKILHRDLKVSKILI